MVDKDNADASRQGATGGAQIYRERKGSPIWPWLLLAALLLGLLFALLNRKHDATEAQTAPISTSAPVVAPAAVTNPAPAITDRVTATGNAVVATTSDANVAGKNIKVHSGTDIATAKPAQASVPGVPLSDVVLFANATDPATFIGRRAKLTNVMVQKVISDRAFFVGPTPQQQALVLLDKGMDAGANENTKVTVASGHPVSLIGVVEAMPTQEAINQTYGVGGADYTAVQFQKAYLHATVAQQK
ncbi:hypothetical protein CCAX7_35920 [Capsulimonas corticalis]|uniref:Uncharacterized protein n=1 Tax=Capsulimonas corticalis TaxID=2219043 RepID=A0A402D782_9BACT|nr:hypothetical protein [Capsulimonas corticalis]BDI31541.1 hypothetical protein CCAX7_35920 [Capsulimonas corticalis]